MLSKGRPSYRPPSLRGLRGQGLLLAIAKEWEDKAEGRLAFLHANIIDRQGRKDPLFQFTVDVSWAPWWHDDMPAPFVEHMIARVQQVI